MKKQADNYAAKKPPTTTTTPSEDQAPFKAAHAKRSHFNKPRVFSNRKNNTNNLQVSDSSTSDSNLDRRKQQPPEPELDRPASNLESQNNAESRSSSVDEAAAATHSMSGDGQQPPPPPPLPQQQYYYSTAVFPPMPLAPYAFAPVGQFPAVMPALFVQSPSAQPVYQPISDQVALEYPRTDQSFPPPFVHQQTTPMNPFYPYCSYSMPGQQALPFQPPYYQAQAMPPAQQAPISQSQLQQLVLQLQQLPQSSVLSQTDLNAILPASSGRARKKSCYNCGSMQHDASECKEPTIDATLQTTQFRLNFKPVDSADSARE